MSSWSAAAPKRPVESGAVVEGVTADRSDVFRVDLRSIE
jgi:hypothetical protein